MCSSDLGVIGNDGLIISGQSISGASNSNFIAMSNYDGSTKIINNYGVQLGGYFYPRFILKLYSYPYTNILISPIALATTDVADSSSALEIRSTISGFLPPRMTNAQAVAISTPATGLQVYDTTNNKNLLYDGTAWRNIATETWVSAQGYLTSVPTLAQVTTAGNTTTNSITVGGLSATLNVAFYNNLTTSSYFSTNGIHSDGRMALYGTDVNGTIQLLAHRGAFGGGAASLFPGSVSVGGITGAIGYQNNNLAIQSHIIGTGIINSGTHKSLAIGKIGRAHV